MGTRVAVAPVRGAGVEALVLRAEIALWSAAAILLFLLERLVPNPLPWVRLGLANAVTLVVLVRRGPIAATAVLALRLLLGGFFAGTLFGPQFLVATAGGVASLGVMAVAAAASGRFLSPLGLSVLGAAAHAVAQLAVAGVWLAGRDVLALLPVFLAVALGTGSAIGLAALVLVRRLDLARGAGVDPRRERR